MRKSRVSKNKRITMQEGSNISVLELLEVYFNECQGRGLSVSTIRTYQQHFHALGRFLDMEKPVGDLTRADFDEMIIKMRAANLARNSIDSYIRTVKAFLAWCNRKGYTPLNILQYKREERIKETYTDSELEALLKKPI